MIRAASKFRSSIPRNRAAISISPSVDSLLGRNDSHESSAVSTPQIHLISVVSCSNVGGSFGSFTPSRRYFSSKGGDDFNDTTTDVDATLNKLFEESQQQLETVSNTGDAWYAAADAASTAAVDFIPTWYNLADQAIVAVKYMHDTTGLEYGYAIMATTVVLRLGLFPLMVQAQKASSRMAHVQPELNAIKARYEALGTPSRQDQLQFSKQMKALFARYDVKPFRAFAAPIVQLPLFLGMFFGLKRMPHIYTDEFAVGGMFWFTDLTVPDPLYILPVTSAITFLGLIEMGKEQMMAQNAAQGKIMINVFRGLSLMMLPVCIGFEASMLCYWTANNFLTMGQTAILKQPSVRKYFGIWDPPKPVPGQEAEGLMETISKLKKKAEGQAVTEEEKIKKHNAAVDAKKNAMRMVRASRARRRGGGTV